MGRGLTPTPGDGVLVLGHSGVVLVPCRERSGAGGFGEGVSTQRGRGEESRGRTRGFRSFPLLVTALTPPWPPLSHSGLPAGIFPPTRRGGCFPPLLGWGRPPAAAPPTPGSPRWGPLARSNRGTRLSGVGWRRCSRWGATSPRCSRWCPSLSQRSALRFCIRFEAWADFWWFVVFFVWQFVPLAKQEFAGSRCHHPSNLQQPGARNNPLCRGTAGDPSPSANLGESWSLRTHQPPWGHLNGLAGGM